MPLVALRSVHCYERTPTIDLFLTASIDNLVLYDTYTKPSLKEDSAQLDSNFIVVVGMKKKTEIMSWLLIKNSEIMKNKGLFLIHVD